MSDLIPMAKHMRRLKFASSAPEVSSIFFPCLFGLELQFHSRLHIIQRYCERWCTALAFHCYATFNLPRCEKRVVLPSLTTKEHFLQFPLMLRTLGPNLARFQ